MKIAYVLNTYPQPSHSFIRREIRALERQGVDVLRMAMRRPDVPLVDPADHEEEQHTDYVLEKGALAMLWALCTVMLVRPARFLGALCLARRIGIASESGLLRHLIYLAEAAHVAGRCSRAGVDHVHAHFGTNATTVAMLANALGGPGYSFTVHGPEEFDAPVALSLGEKIHRSRFVVGISQFGKSQLCRWVSHDQWPKINVVHCGIEPGLFPQITEIPDGPMRLVSIGRFVEQKGQMALIATLALLKASLPDIHLTLIGDGPMRQTIEDEITRQNLSTQITLTGWLDEAAVRSELVKAHALVMPSFAEGLPMVVMEAMAASRPVIATYIAGIPELVQHGKTGWLVPAGDASALADTIIEFAGITKKRRAEIGEAAMSRALQRHDVDQEAAKLKALFEGAQF